MEKIKKILFPNSVQGIAILIAIFTFLNHFVSLLRDRIFASKFGPSSTLDMYYAAFNIPDFIYIIAFSFVSGIVLIPIFTKAIKKENWENFNKLFFTFFNAFLLFIIPITLIIYYFVPEIVSLYLPGYTLTQKEEIIPLIRIMLLQPIFLGISNLISSLAQTENKFLAFSFAPIMYNFGIIIGAIYFYDIYGINGLGFGVILGSIMYLFIQLIYLLKNWHHKNFFYTFKIIWPEIFNVFRNYYLRIISLFMLQIKAISFAFFSSLLGVGALSIFKITNNIEEIFFSLIAISYSVAAFPLLSKLEEEKKDKEFENEIIKGIKYILFFTIPIIIYVILMRAYIIRIILGSGQINWEMTKIFALSLAILILSLSLKSVSYFLIRSAYAKGNQFIHFISQIISIFFMIISFYFIIKFLPDIYTNNKIIFDKAFEILRLGNISTLDKVKLFVIPIVYTIILFIEFLIIVYFIQKKKIFNFKKLIFIKKTILDILLSSFILFILLYSLLRFFEPLSVVKIGNYETLPGLILQTLITSLFAFLIWYLVLRFRKNEEILILEKSIKDKIWKKKVEVINDSERI